MRRYRRTEKSRPILCECGVTCKGLQRYTQHFETGAHEKVLYIQDALRHEDTLEAVGNDLGVTKERIRQIAKATGVLSARERLRQRKLRELLEYEEKEPKWLQKIWPLLAEKGIEVQDWASRNGRRGGHRLVKIQDRTCAFTTLIPRKTIGKTYFHLYIPSPRDYEFLLANSTVGWFVFPEKMLPATGTMFVWEPDPRYGANGYQHGYQRCHEAWQLLKKGEDGGLATEGRV